MFNKEPPRIQHSNCIIHDIVRYVFGLIINPVHSLYTVSFGPHISLLCSGWSTRTI